MGGSITGGTIKGGKVLSGAVTGNAVVGGGEFKTYTISENAQFYGGTLQRNLAGSVKLCWNANSNSIDSSCTATIGSGVNISGAVVVWGNAQLTGGSVSGSVKAYGNAQIKGGNISGGSVNEFVQIYDNTQVYANGPSSSGTSPSFETVEECCYWCGTHRSGTVTCPSGYSTINTVITGGTYSGESIKGGKFGGSFRLCSGTPPSSDCSYTNYHTYSTSCGYFCLGPKWCSYKTADPYPTQKSYTSGSYGC